MRRRLIPALMLVLVGCGTQATKTVEPASEGAPLPSVLGVPDSQIGLRTESVFEIAIPGVYVAPDTDPGDNALLPRANGEAPPLVPHALEEMLPITQEENLCIECHGRPGEASIGTSMSASHFKDLRHAPDTLREEIAGARWYCVSCHVSQTDAAPLVRNPGR